MSNAWADVDVASSYREGAVQAATGVADLLLDGFRKPMTKDFKRDRHDIVTKYDGLAEQSIIESLTHSFPGSSIVAEETGKTSGTDLTWHIDPIDGTSNFSRGIDFWCVSIAAVVGSDVVAAVVYSPPSDLLFSADLNGAWLNGRALQLESESTEIEATLISSFPSAKDVSLVGDKVFMAEHRFLDEFQAVRNLGSGALNLSYVAAGWADATMGLDTNSWDIAAGGFILEQSGGTTYGFRRGLPVDTFHECRDYYAVGGFQEFSTLGSQVVELSLSY